MPVQFYVTLAGFAVIILLINCWRMVFLLSQLSELKIEYLTTYAAAFWVGFPLDAVIAGYFILPVFLTIYWPWIGWHSKRYPRFFRSYMALVFAIISFLQLADISFFSEFGTHLNLLAVQHNATQQDTLRYIWHNYPVVWYVVVIVLVSLGLSLLLGKIIRKLPDTVAKWGWNTASILAGLILLFTAVRGGWQERPVDWGIAMFSDHAPANQIALNPIFFLGRSVLELSSEKNLDQQLTYYDLSEAIAETRELLNDGSIKFTDDHTLSRVFVNPAKPISPNIVLVIMESQVGEFCGFINPEMKAVTPNLDTLAEKGLMFRNCFANGKRSAYGISSLLCSWPVIPGFPLISQIESARRITTAGTIFKTLGYETCFLYGGDADFDNMKGFVTANGFDRVIERDAFPAFTPGTTWGVFDHFVFAKALSLLDEASAPLFLTLFTTTNHQPFIVPEEYEPFIPELPKSTYREGKPLRTMSYVDRVIGEFMAKGKDHPWFENTLFIFISDHGLSVHREIFEDPRNANIPFLMYGPSIIKTPRVVDSVVSQVDVLPQILSLIGYPSEFSVFGRNALADEKGFACRVTNDHVLWVEKELLYEENLGQNSRLFQYKSLYQAPYQEIPATDPRFQDVQKRCRSYLQSAFFLFKER
ncbi:MAG: sulfatase-like hydrolase/transferase [FCB group bacterium]|nr:sulfatase-like hydrolase/transferase [FCB group bacterium]